MLLKRAWSAMCRAAGLLGFLALSSAAMAGPAPHSGWSFQIFAKNLPRADNILFAADGSLIVSLENKDGEGRVVRLKDGRQVTIAGKLERPDGLALRGEHLFITEEVADGRVLRVNLVHGTQRVLARLQKPEGIVPLHSGGLIIAEDNKENGRIVRVSEDGTVDVLASNLKRPEGLARGPGGILYVAETGAGRILAMSDVGTRALVGGLKEPDQIALAPDGALWITEDLKQGRLLRYHAGELTTVLSRLNKPQGITFDAAGRIYVAEQGRDRVLVLAPLLKQARNIPVPRLRPSL